MLELLSDPAAWLSFITLTILEIVLGIDNIVFLSILVSRLPPDKRRRARLGGLGLAMLTRIALLFSITWLIALRAPLFVVAGNEISSRDLVLIAGGLFLLWKSVVEIHSAVEGPREAPPRPVRGPKRVVLVMLQIAVVDIVFSLDSVFTAVGVAQNVAIMAAAIVAAVLFMMFVAGRVSEFIDHHPTVKVLALAFLILIGITLIAEGLDFHIPKGYLYFSMAFAIAVEMLNIRRRRRPSAGASPGARSAPEES